MNLALFDFDGTITTRGTYLDFIRFAVSRRRWLLGSAALTPWIAGYRMGLLSERGVRPIVSRVAFAGTSAQRLVDLGEDFATRTIPPLVRDEARRRIAWHQQQGDLVVVVSASLDVYLNAWCRAQGVELICTTLEVKQGVVTGRYLGGDCTGAAKRERIVQRYELASYDTIYAYGDSHEDDEMLSLAQRRFFRWREST